MFITASILTAVFISTLPGANSSDTFVTLEIDLKSFFGDGKDVKGRACEAFSTSRCDPYFTICVDEPDGPFEKTLRPDLEQCAYYSKRSGQTYEDSEVLIFGDNIGGIPLPLKVNITDWQGGFLLKIAITDSDSGSIIPNGDDLIDFLEGKFMMDDPGQNGTNVIKAEVELRGYRMTNYITTEYTSYCHLNYYHGETDPCQVYCADQDDDTGHFTCAKNGTKLCLSGWENAENNCINSTDDCVNNTCSVAATCVDGHGTYTCVCPPGWENPENNCINSTDDCVNNTCSVAATCVDGHGTYTCVCPQGWENPENNCINSTDDCVNNSCSAAATCVDGHGTYTCVCPPGWENPENNCINSTDDCVNNNCPTSATCVDGHGTYTCECPPGRTGPLCTEKIITCKDNPCAKSAACEMNSTGGIVCICKDGIKKTGCVVPGLDKDNSRNEINPAGSQEDRTLIQNNFPLIIGLICGMVLLLLIIILLVAILLTRRRKRRKQKDQATAASVDTANAELQAGTRTSDTGTATFGNPLYLASGTTPAEPNHYSEVDYNQVKIPLPVINPHDDYPVKSKAAEAGFIPEPEPLPVKRKIPAGAVPVYMNQAGHLPVYENQYSRSPGGNPGGARGGGPPVKGGFSPMYGRQDLGGERSGQFDNPTYDSSLDPDGLEAPNGKFDMRKKDLMYGYEEPLRAKP